MREMVVTVFHMLAALTLAAVAGCGTGDQVTANAPEDVRISCGSGRDGFLAGSLNNPTGAEDAATPEAAGLRSLIKNPDGIGELPRTGWRLLDRDDDRVTFGAEDAGGLTVVSLRPDGDRWVFSGSVHGCADLMVIPPEGWSSAVWWPDPDRELGDGHVLHVLATDRNCASGMPTADRLRPPTISIADDSIAITFTARPLSGIQTCQGHPPTPYRIELDEPVGDRKLLDGAFWPPRPPEPQL